jgi:hypothetical protein
MARRRVLLGRIASQRESLGQDIKPWVGPLALIDQGLGALRFLRRHPVLVAGGVSLLLTLYPRGRGGVWFGRGLIAWRLLNKFTQNPETR